MFESPDEVVRLCKAFGLKAPKASPKFERTKKPTIVNVPQNLNPVVVAGPAPQAGNPKFAAIVFAGRGNSERTNCWNFLRPVGQGAEAVKDTPGAQNASKFASIFCARAK